MSTTYESRSMFAGYSPLTNRDVDALLAGGTVGGRALVAALYVLALRHTEAAALKWVDVDLARGRIWIVARKSGLGGYYPLPQAVTLLLAQHQGCELAKHRGNLPEWVFPSAWTENGDGHTPQAPSRFSILRRLQAQAKACAVVLPFKMCTPLRHAAAQALVDTGAPLSIAGAALRHKSLRSTAVYCRPHSGGDGTADLARRLRALLDQAQADASRR